MRGFPGGQMVKNLPAVQKTWVWCLGWEDPLEKEMATCSSIRAWRIPWTEELVGPWSHKKLIPEQCSHMLSLKLIVFSIMYLWTNKTCPSRHESQSRNNGNCCFCSVPRLCPTLCDPWMPGFSGLHYLLEFAEIHVHWLSQWCYLTITSSATLFSFCFLCFPASGSFPVSPLFSSGGQSRVIEELWSNHFWDFPGGPVVGLCASTVGDMGVVPGHGTGILHAAWPKKKKLLLAFFSPQLQSGNDNMYLIELWGSNVVM